MESRKKKAAAIAAVVSYLKTEQEAVIKSLHDFI